MCRFWKQKTIYLFTACKPCLNETSAVTTEDMDMGGTLWLMSRFRDDTKFNSIITPDTGELKLMLVSLFTKVI